MIGSNSMTAHPVVSLVGSRDSILTTMAKACCRQWSIHRSGRVHVYVRTLATKSPGSRYQEEQEHVWHGQQEGCYHWHSNSTGWGGCIQMVQLVKEIRDTLFRRILLCEHTRRRKWDSKDTTTTVNIL